MAVFRMNTSTLDSAISSINGYRNSIEEAVSAIAGYDTANDDNFDFGGAKKSLLKSAEGIYDKVLNTAKYIETCETSHMELQKMLSADIAASETPAEEEKTSEEETAVAGDTPSTSGPATDTDTTSSDRDITDNTNPKIEEQVVSNPSVSSGTTPSKPKTSHPKSTPKQTMKTGVTPAPKVDEVSKIKDTVVPAVPPVLSGIDYLDSIISDEEAESDLEQLKEESSVPETDSSSTEVLPSVDSNLPQTINAVEAPSTISNDSARVFEDDDFSYDNQGCAKLGDNYVVSCNESVGKVGDELVITSSNGESVKCVVGNTINNNDSINMIVDKGTYSSNSSAISQKFNGHISKIENNGQSSLLPPLGVGGGETTNVTPNVNVGTTDDNNQAGDDNNG
jgi:hypothetical protein